MRNLELGVSEKVVELLDLSFVHRRRQGSSATTSHTATAATSEAATIKATSASAAAASTTKAAAASTDAEQFKGDLLPSVSTGRREVRAGLTLSMPGRTKAE